MRATPGPVKGGALTLSVVAALLALVTVIVINGSLAYRNLQHLREDAAWVAHSHMVQAAVNDVLLLVVDAETGERGFILTGEERYLEPYDVALVQLQERINGLSQLVGDDPTQSAATHRLQQLIAVQLSIYKEVIAARRAGATSPTGMLSIGTGKANMDNLRAHVAGMQRAEEELLLKREVTSADAYNRAVVTGAITAFMGLLTVGIFTWFLRRNLLQRQQAAALLFEHREWLRTTLDSIGDGVVATSTDGGVLLLNKVAQELSGWSQEAAAGKPVASVLNLVTENTREPVENPLMRALSEQGSVELANQTVLVARNGTERFIDDSAAPVRDEEGRITGGVLTFRDVTDRKRAERAMLESEERFRLLADTIPQLSWIADGGTDGHVNWFNQVWFNYTGSTLEEMKGLGWHKVQHPEHLDRVTRKFARHVKEGMDWEDTFPMRGRNGEYRWFLSRMKVIRDAQGSVVRLVGTGTDITSQRELEEELRQNAVAMAEADARKNEFLAMLAHELRNPLAPIRNAAQLLKMDGDDRGTVTMAAAMMERQVGQLVRLVDDLLDVSRISRGKISLRKEHVQLASVVEHAVETVQPLFTRLVHTFTVTLPPQPVHLHVDAARLAQVLSNLLTNAGKFTPHGGTISLTATANAQQVEIRIRDSGIGMSAAQLPRVFELFMQADTSLERTLSGLGIGLTLVQRLVEMHGGSVEAFSAGLDKGSEFVVRLPVVQATAVPAKVPSATEQANTARRILVVDDNVDSADMMAMVMKKNGHAVMTANDGIAALDLAERYNPDVILLDIGLPKLSGYGVCARIREQVWGEHMMIIALTGYGQEDDRQKSIAAGFDGHLVKPVDVKALLDLVGNSRPVGESAGR